MNNLELPAPAEMQPAARAAEITSILAAALLRGADPELPAEQPVRLGFVAQQRVHPTPYPNERS